MAKQLTSEQEKFIEDNQSRDAKELASELGVGVTLVRTHLKNLKDADSDAEDGEGGDDGVPSLEPLHGGEEDTGEEEAGVGENVGGEHDGVEQVAHTGETPTKKVVQSGSTRSGHGVALTEAGSSIPSKTAKANGRKHIHVIDPEKDVT